MRILSAAAVAAFNESGIEPVILVQIYWGGGEGVVYSDRRFQSHGFVGRLITVGTIDDIVNVDNSSSSAQVNVVLDDSDGSLKQIFNNTDIHKTRVRLLQWCTDLPPNEAFVIFTGQICSPIEWKESDRTLSFEVVTQIEDRIVGFAVEQGNFNMFPSKLIGKAWPLVFGQVAGVSPLQILEAPTGILAESMGILNEDVWQKELQELRDARVEALNNARAAYQAGVGEAIIASRYKGQFLNFLKDDPSAAQSHDQAADSYFAQSAQYTDDSFNIDQKLVEKEIIYNSQKGYDKTVFRVHSITMPSGVPLVFKIGDSTFHGTYNGGYFHTSLRVFPENYNAPPAFNTLQQFRQLGEGNKLNTTDFYGKDQQGSAFGQKFQWIDAGTEVKVTNFPLTYVVSVGAVAVTAVWGHRRGVRTVLPANYYVVQHVQMGNTICTLVTLLQPLTSKTFFNGKTEVDEGWDNDQIEIDCISAVGPNTVDILVWIISLFTDFGIDAASFNFVRPLVEKCPMHFALTSRKNAVTLLKELAFQARCSIWLNDGVFFIRYMPLPPTPIDTITDEDVVLNTLAITCEETENIVTSFVATWKPNLFQTDEFKIIYQYNIPRYGFHEESYDFYAYNIEECVKKSAEFWMIRKSNSFKLIKFKTALHKIRLETFDAVTLDFDPGLIANGPVTGTILKATYDTKEKLIDMLVWIPVRFGEMDVFPFAEPFYVTSVYPLLNDPNLKTENPFELAGLFPQEQFFGEMHSPFQHHLPSNLPPMTGRGQQIYDAGMDAQIPVITNYGIVAGLPINPSNIGVESLRVSNDYIRATVRPVTAATITQPTTGVFPGIVRGRTGGNSYSVAVYFGGMSASPTLSTVKQFLIHSADVIENGTPVAVHRSVYQGTNGTIIELWMQAPTWQPADTGSEGTAP